MVKLRLLATFLCIQPSNFRASSTWWIPVQHNCGWTRSCQFWAANWIVNQKETRSCRWTQSCLCGLHGLSTLKWRFLNALLGTMFLAVMKQRLLAKFSFIQPSNFRASSTWWIPVKHNCGWTRSCQFWAANWIFYQKETRSCKWTQSCLCGLHGLFTLKWRFFNALLVHILQ